MSFEVKLFSTVNTIKVNKILYTSFLGKNNVIPTVKSYKELTVILILESYGLRSISLPSPTRVEK